MNSTGTSQAQIAHMWGAIVAHSSLGAVTKQNDRHILQTQNTWWTDMTNEWRASEWAQLFIRLPYSS